MRPIACPMCQRFISGNELRTTNNCPGCGADISRALQQQENAAARKTNSVKARARAFIESCASFSLIAPFLAIVIGVLGYQGLRANFEAMVLLGVVCGVFVAFGFLLGTLAFFAGTSGKASLGIFINGFVIGLTVLAYFRYQEIAVQARDVGIQIIRTNGWSHIIGK